MTYKSVFISLLITLLGYIAIGVSRADDIRITTCDFASVQSAIRDANGLDEAVIQFDCEGTISFTTQISITGDIHLIGNNAITLDGTGTTRLFDVTDGASLTLNGFTLQNGNAFGGGAIFNSYNSTLTISDSTFSGNSASRYGGAIFNGYNSTLTISDSTFTGNSAGRGGAIDNEPSGTLTISNSTFTGNLAGSSGGAVYNDGTLTIGSSTFTGNSSDAGGAIFNDSTVSSQDTHYENNTCFGDITDNGGNTGMNARGCPITTPSDDDTGDATISTCDFATLQSAVSVANSGGGTISITCTGAIIFDDNLSIADNIIIQNDSGGEVIFDETGDDNHFFSVRRGVSLTLNGFTLQNGNAENGGAIFNDGTLTISNSTFTDNSASNYGGAIYNQGMLIVSNSTFIGNSASYGGAIYYNSGTQTVSNSTFMGNSADFNGGAIANFGTLTISNSTFIGNSAHYLGGAIANFGTLTISNSTFMDNLASVGSAVFSNRRASSQDTHYENNTCFGDITDNGGNTITNSRGCPITEPVNDADTGDATISTCDFATLQSAVSIANSGGGIIIITCTGTIIFNNELTIADNVVIQNDSGGEVIFDGMGNDNRFFSVRYDASLTLNGFTLQNGNTIEDGGGAILNYGTLTISNSTFLGNSASYGGAIYNDFNGTLTISNSLFTGNSASRDEGGAMLNYGMLSITDSTFTDNSASYGGAISNFRTLTITNSTFTDNSASYGGAIFNNDYSTATSQDTHYENNTCAGDITDFGGNRAENAEGCPQS